VLTVEMAELTMVELRVVVLPVAEAMVERSKEEHLEHVGLEVDGRLRARSAELHSMGRFTHDIPAGIDQRYRSSGRSAAKASR
jgi:hypothetical protein